MSVENKQLSILDIMEKLPHRFPFLMIDRVLNWTAFESIEIIKNVSINEPFFQGHFPKNPIMPGVLILEVIAQAAGVLAYLSDEKSHKDNLFYLASVENAKFKKIVTPGDTLKVCVQFKSARGRFLKVQGEAYVDGQLACSADVLCAQG